MAALVGGLSVLLPNIDTGVKGLARLWAFPPLLAVAGVGAAGFLAALRLLGGIDPQDRRQLDQMRLPLKRCVARTTAYCRLRSMQAMNPKRLSRARSSGSLPTLRLVTEKTGATKL